MAAVSVASSDKGPAPTLEIQDSVCCERHTLVLRGELDLSSAATLESIVQRLCGDGAKSLSLELELAFMDSSGLRAVLASRNLCLCSDCELAIRVNSRAVQRLFEVAGVINQLPIVPAKRPTP